MSKLKEILKKRKETEPEHRLDRIKRALGKEEIKEDESKELIEEIENLNKELLDLKTEDEINIEFPDNDKIIEAQKEITEAIKGIEIPKTDLKPILDKIELLKDALNNKDLVVNVPKTIIDIKGIIKAIDDLKVSLPRPEKQIIIDYSEKLEKLLEVFNKLKFDKSGNLLVMNTRADMIRGGGGLDSTDSTNLQTIATNSATQATEDKQDDIIAELQNLTGFEIPAYDYIAVTYPTTTQEVYVYKTGGSGGATVATITVNYTDTTKEYITNITKA